MSNKVPYAQIKHNRNINCNVYDVFFGVFSYKNVDIYQLRVIVCNVTSKRSYTCVCSAVFCDKSFSFNRRPSDQHHSGPAQETMLS